MLSRSAEYEGAFETRDKTFVGGFWTGERLETSVSLRMFLPWDLGRITGEGSVSFQTRPSRDEGVQKGAMPSATWRCLSGKSERDSIKPSERRRSSRAAELPDLSGLPCVCAVLLLKALPSAVLPLSFFSREVWSPSPVAMRKAMLLYYRYFVFGARDGVGLVRKRAGGGALS